MNYPLSLIVAMDDDGCIGKDNGFPWPRIQSDMKHFHDVTIKHPVIMGRKTYESIIQLNGRPLSGRINYVLSHNASFKPDKVLVCHSLETAIRSASFYSEHEPFIIGGASLYEQALPSVTKMYITHVLGSFEGDAYFSAWRLDDWQRQAFTAVRDEATGLDLQFEEFVRCDK